MNKKVNSNDIIIFLVFIGCCFIFLILILMGTQLYYYKMNLIFDPICNKCGYHKETDFHCFKADECLIECDSNIILNVTKNYTYDKWGIKKQDQFISQCIAINFKGAKLE